MAIAVYPATPGFAAEVGDVDLSRPLAQDDAEAIKAAFWQYAVLVFPSNVLSPNTISPLRSCSARSSPIACST